LLPILGYVVVGDGIRCCQWVEVDGVWLILSLNLGFVQWVSMCCRVGFLVDSGGGFDLRWVEVGCGVGRGGGGGFLSIRVVLGWLFSFFLFLRCAKHCKIFAGAFPGMQPSNQTLKKNLFS
jgi:hypothetical protein